MGYNIKIDAFEGPMDLLLHLINRLEIDIYDIPMADITDQYLSYIHTMQHLELDVASEYLVMAATLLAIKSKTLLPKHEDELMIDEDGEIFEEDPRDELVEKLLEYKKYKNAAEEFKGMEEERSLIFTKPPSDLSVYVKEAESDKQELNISLYDMLGALQKLLRRQKIQKPLYTKVTKQEISIEKRMDEIMIELQSIKGKKSFFELFSLPVKEHIVITFMAVLELMKLNEIIVEQEDNFSDIMIAAKEGVEPVGSY
ncbi:MULTISPECIES: segregation/condensation protein A [Bacillaceae]|jgi:segregation and condensation protein A|uniref:segregation/condensation protein A n=1 Tax=Bacillaceae TaxID=186817 RepID=UPI000BF4C6AC|nr:MULTISPECIES: segregation/condensation protein A [Bacillaceae]MBT2665335.1 segregation/condensation protein A [Bacillus sp. ISL-4]PEZ82190.1 segregation/condensation protein A [Bacillus sp. AFS017274]